MDTKRLYTNLSERRKALKLTQVQLVAKLQSLGLDIEQPKLSDIENGKFTPTWDMVPYFAAALKITPNDLLLWEEFIKEHT